MVHGLRASPWIRALRDLPPHCRRRRPLLDRKALHLIARAGLIEAQIVAWTVTQGQDLRIPYGPGARLTRQAGK